ncbi:hypothetical protein PYW08_000648 [Mythimna loreyi]|uniref:Uncharacterized protein n=1 Tax=Mythimna loreyi TaxID=667449 RepID=A0ACC2RD05_9NEOP|nr:hypothetical protein PYW08_000648 [Mythimna loreyi]
MFIILFRITFSVLVISNSVGKRVVVPAQFQDTHLRIPHGRDVKPDEYSAVIVLFDLEISAMRKCSGVMVTEYWGLTAAHCTMYGIPFHAWYKNFTAEPFRLDLAAEVIETFTHPSFRVVLLNKVYLVENDISLFHSLKVNLKSFARLSAVDYSTLLGLHVTYVGGGSTTFEAEFDYHMSPEDNSRQLQIGEGLITPCRPEMRIQSKYVMCVSPTCANRYQGAGTGDSGGPLIYDHRIVGICSFGLMSHVIISTAYTPVSPYLDWIYQVIHSGDAY